jgi:lipoyl(octanoyl) transferase
MMTRGATIPTRLLAAGVKRTIHQASAAARRQCRVYDTFEAGHAQVDYERAWRWQRHLMESQGAVHKAGSEGSDALILLQHPSTFTLGRGSTLDNLKFSLDAGCKQRVVRIERGGEVTWHGPGQLVVYPIFDLHFHKQDLRWWVTNLEKAVIRTLAQYNIQGQRDDINTGVWVAKSKVSRKFKQQDCGSLPRTLDLLCMYVCAAADMCHRRECQSMGDDARARAEH